VSAVKKQLTARPSSRQHLKGGRRNWGQQRGFGGPVGSEGLSVFES